ncbi:hypothetical protein [Pseudanabaena sp. PCC 6802]|uniref:hypothetical protein n=1 Tax=Pseudanabaena sp. PCC 6802 TaxID=118173 RepID=UPI0003686F33|nr:hypothetical protein [Pseudanabaena sp. PCC 6802]
MQISKVTFSVLLAPFILLVTTNCASNPSVASEPIPIDPPPLTTSKSSGERLHSSVPRCVTWPEFERASEGKRIDSSNRSNSLDLNKPQAWKDWERPYAPNAVNIFYRTVLVDSYYLNREEVVRLLEATKDRWQSPAAPTANSAHTSDSSTCSLKNWNLLDPYGEVTFTIAVTNRSKRKQQILAVELEILDKDGNDLRTLSNPYRRYQGWTFGFEPPLRDGETREVEGFRKYMVGWHQVKLKRCQWLNSSEQYRQLYPEINNIYLP